ncbi:MAG TPA: PQQ-binding-like beta-propeller repeat protein [Candidatus Kapabacteria bacterium]|nr:PQQ-binding-like beta-propeller repeat protein [Candidatus Kapabacteria bacterium]
MKSRSLRLPPPLALIALTLLWSGCSGSGGPAFDAFNAYNLDGGAARACNFSDRKPGPAGMLRPFLYHNLHGGLLGPPLELPLACFGFVTRSDAGSVLSVARQDSLFWSFTAPAGEYFMPGIAADSAGRIYAITTRGHLFALTPEGTRLRDWQTQDCPGGLVLPSPLLALGSGTVLGNSNGEVMRYDAEGRLLWKVRRGASASDAMAADPHIGLAVPISHNSFDLADTLLLLDPATGSQRWAQSPGGRIVQGPVIVGNLLMVGVVAQRDSLHQIPSLVAFTPEGKPAWRMPLLLTPRGIAGDNEGNIYVSGSGTGDEASGGILESVDPTGRERWQVTLKSGIPAAPAVSNDWVFFISRRDGRTGLFTYGRDGHFQNFVAIDVLPDVHARLTISSLGELVLAALDQPAIIVGR